MIFFSIIQRAPIWVWPVLMLLVFFGFRASRQRNIPLIVIYLLPVLGLFSVNAVLSLGASTAVWVAFILIYGLGGWLGFHFQGSRIIEKTERSVKVAGEWLTLFMLMVVFWMNFVGGVAQAIMPEIYLSSQFHIAFACVAGSSAGSFLGRAIRVFKA